MSSLVHSIAGVHLALGLALGLHHHQMAIKDTILDRRNERIFHCGYIAGNSRVLNPVSSTRVNIYSVFFKRRVKSVCADIHGKETDPVWLPPCVALGSLWKD